MSTPPQLLLVRFSSVNSFWYRSVWECRLPFFTVRTVWGNLSEKWLLKCSKRNLLRQCLVWFLVFSLFEVVELSRYTARFINRVMVYANEGHAHNTGLRTHKMKMLVVGLHGTGLASGMVWHSSLRLKTLGQRWFHTSWDHYTTLQWTVIHCASSAFVWVSSSSAFLCPLQDDNRTNRFYRAPALKFYFFPPSSCLHFPAFSRIENSLILSFFVVHRSPFKYSFKVKILIWSWERFPCFAKFKQAFVIHNLWDIPSTGAQTHMMQCRIRLFYTHLPKNPRTLWTIEWVWNSVLWTWLTP